MVLKYCSWVRRRFCSARSKFSRSSAIGGNSATASIAALTSALSAKGVDGDTANRALYAYRRSMGMTAQPVLASAY